MNRVSKLITVIDQFADTKFCKQVYNYLVEKTNNPYVNDNNMPWFIGNNVYYDNIDDNKIKKGIYDINHTLATLLSYVHNTKVYPHFCDVVLWREGQHMDRHVDDGSMQYGHDNLHMRKFSAIIYLNEDYTGGETFISNGKSDYVVSPKVGRAVCFTSDKRSAHGVNRIDSGMRGTIAMWFCTDKQFCNM